MNRPLAMPRMKSGACSVSSAQSAGDSRRNTSLKDPVCENAEKSALPDTHLCPYLGQSVYDQRPSMYTALPDTALRNPTSATSEAVAV